MLVIRAILRSEVKDYDRYLCMASDILMQNSFIFLFIDFCCCFCVINFYFTVIQRSWPTLTILCLNILTKIYKIISLAFHFNQRLLISWLSITSFRSFVYIIYLHNKGKLFFDTWWLSMRGYQSTHEILL